MKLINFSIQLVITLAIIWAMSALTACMSMDQDVAYKAISGVSRSPASK